MDGGPPQIGGSAMSNLIGGNQQQQQQQQPFGGGGDVARKPMNAAFERAFAADNHQHKPSPFAHMQESGGGGYNSGYGGSFGGAIGNGGNGANYSGRSSTRVHAPPGGASSICFG